MNFTYSSTSGQRKTQTKRVIIKNGKRVSEKFSETVENSTDQGPVKHYTYWTKENDRFTSHYSTRTPINQSTQGHTLPNNSSRQTSNYQFSFKTNPALLIGSGIISLLTFLYIYFIYNKDESPDEAK